MVTLIMDRDSTFEMGRYFGAHSSRCSRASMPSGRLMANDPRQYGGSMDAAAAQKMEKFVDCATPSTCPS